MTAVLEAPVHQQTGNRRRVHWCCVLQHAPPIFGLCGALPISQKRVASLRVDCPKCLELVIDHVGACEACRPFAGRY